MKHRATVSLPNDTEVSTEDGRQFIVSGSVEVQFAWIDQGIGGYGYGERSLSDVQMGAEDLRIVGLDNDFDAGAELPDGDWDSVKLDKDLTASLVAALNRKLEGGGSLWSHLCDAIEAPEQ